MNIPFLITVTGPIVGIFGWGLHWPWLFWLGAAVCALNLILNMASGVMKLPILPLLFMAVAVAQVSPWWQGVGAGLVAWTGLEALGEVYARIQRTRRGDA